MICSENFKYSLETYYNRKTRMMYPTNTGSFSIKEIDIDEGEYLLSGQTSAPGKEPPRIKITISGGSVNLIQH